jgi:hypothetical protein
MDKAEIDTDITDQLMTHAIAIVNYAHQISNNPADYELFVSGVDNHERITDKCLIIEEYYGTLMYKLHTPLGAWSIGSLQSSRAPAVKKQMSEYLGLKMLCPGRQIPNLGFVGPYWLVTSFGCQPIPHPTIGLLPERAPIEPRRLTDSWYTELIPELVEVYRTYRTQLSLFFIEDPADDVRRVLNQQFNAYLTQWIRSGLIGGNLLPRSPLESGYYWIRSEGASGERSAPAMLLDATDVNYQMELNWLLAPLAKDAKRWVCFDSANRVQVVFRLICEILGGAKLPQTPLLG